MDPIVPLQTLVPTQNYINFAFAPGIFPTKDEGEKFLNNLDSDTRAYVLKHTDEFRSKDDIIRCIDDLHGAK